MTKKQEGMFNFYSWAYNRGPKTELWEVYGSYSTAKAKALEYCKELQNRFNGYSATIVGASSHFFSYAFRYFDATLGKECLCYCTHCNDYKFPIE